MKWILFTKWLPRVQEGIQLHKDNLTKWEKHFNKQGIPVRRVKNGKREALEIFVDE